MALGKELGSYTLKQTGVHYSEDGSSVTVDCDGTATDFGTVLGTLIIRTDPGATRGACSWRGQSFLENGERSEATGEGTWQDSGKNQWRVRLLVSTSDGQTFGTDGILDLATRSLNGKMLDWS
jgi:hypothetical protein